MLSLWTLCPFNVPLTQSATQLLTPLMALGNRQLNVLVISVLSYSPYVGVTILNLVMFSNTIVMKIWFMPLTWNSSAYNLKIWSLYGVLWFLHIPSMHAYVCVCFNFFSDSLLAWSNSSTLSSSPGILSCACFLQLVRLLQSFLVGIIAFTIPFSFHMGFPSIFLSL